MRKIIISTFIVCLSVILLWGIQPNPAYGLSHYSKTLATHSNASHSLIDTAGNDQEYPVSSNPSSIIFEMRHYVDNTYALPSPVKLTIALNENEQPRNNIEIFIPDNLNDKIRVRGTVGTLYPGQPVTLFVEFVDKDLNSKKPSDFGNLEFYSDGEVLCSVRVSYYIDGLYDEHKADDIERYSGERIRMGLSGPVYKRIGTIYLDKETVPPFTISFTPFILETDETDNGLGIEPGNDSVKAVLLNPDGLFEFSDHTTYMEISNGNKEITFQIHMKDNAFQELKEKAKLTPQTYIGSYILSDLVFEYRDGCTAGGKMNPLPLIYTVKVTEESGSGSGGGGSGSGGSGGGSGGSSGGSSGGGSTSGGPGDYAFADNEYNHMVNEDLGWRQADDGTWFYLNNKSEKKTGWLVDFTGTWYYLGSDGKMATGWLQYRNNWYYLMPNGAMATGWILLDHTWYYLNGDGSMKTGWFQDSKEKWYYLNPDGGMAVQTWTPDGYWVDEVGVWRS